MADRKKAKMPRGPRTDLLDSFRTPVVKAPDVDPVLIQPRGAVQLAAVPDLKTSSSPSAASPAAAAAAPDSNAAGNSGVSEPDTETAPAGNSGVSEEAAAAESQPQPEPAPAQPADPQVPAEPAENTQPPAPAPPPAEAAQFEVAAPPAGEGSPAPAQPVKVKPVKFTVMLAADEADRARAAYMNLPANLRPRSFSEFAGAPIMERVRAIEAEYNDGQPFDPIGPGQIPTGRPLGSKVNREPDA